MQKELQSMNTFHKPSHNLIDCQSAFVCSSTHSTSTTTTFYCEQQKTPNDEDLEYSINTFYEKHYNVGGIFPAQRQFFRVQMHTFE
jgi:hypothetical protein